MLATYCKEWLGLIVSAYYFPFSFFRNNIGKNIRKFSTASVEFSST